VGSSLFNKSSKISQLETSDLRKAGFRLHKLLLKYSLSNNDFTSFLSKKLFVSGGEFKKITVINCFNEFTTSFSDLETKSMLVKLTEVYFDRYGEIMNSEMLDDTVLAYMYKLGYKSSRAEFIKFHRNLLNTFASKETTRNIPIPSGKLWIILNIWIIVLPGDIRVNISEVIDSNKGLNGCVDLITKIGIKQ
jgi:hypothetical protein